MPRILIPTLQAAPGRPAGDRVQALDGATMGTRWSVRWVGSARPEVLRARIQARLDIVVAQMSGWEPGSDLSRFNRAPAGSWQRLPAEFLAVLDCALAIAAETGGAFDPSIGRLVDLWGFGPRPAPTPGPPGAELLAPARAGGGWQRLRLDVPGGRALQPGGLGLDLSGIAKGYAVDLVAEALATAGVAAFLVEIGGELRGQGMKPDGTPWWVALETPPGEQPMEAAGGEEYVVALHGLSVATSGDYRRFFQHGGRRYGHTLDPRTGWPVEESLASVTVLHPNCMRADALATALSVLGTEAGLHHARRHGIAARFLTREAGRLREHVSPAFAAMLD
ncbi:FAD:protein FMN transferase [Siccirubricoccus deserti]|uniref:FAD:protein FMN transferase n=1 Tax=Siccirubricoccus deserti TaxID=2013562 RepID=A0A9X0QYR4_9PROT|nr:FAD:protein FMN transferase [Siccirubricoccus deserti]MBC4016484.1 FAD:protein FMN transferase [Siccirubricoccus deserti]GGC48593.1 FAD:protein FMN transferase [Siccirubricoccus deserti]